LKDQVENLYSDFINIEKTEYIKIYKHEFDGLMLSNNVTSVVSLLFEFLKNNNS
jgi:hypothetical protein